MYNNIKSLLTYSLERGHYGVATAL